MTGSAHSGCRRRFGFTLIELLTVISIVALLLSILLPSLQKARRQARVVLCAANLRTVGLAIRAYANDFNDSIPLGPEGLPAPNFYAVKGNVTSLISLSNRKPVGLGQLLSGYLDRQPKVLFCPGTDQPSDAAVQLARVGYYEAQCDYYYRHASVALLSGDPDLSHLRFSSLGRNRNGRSIRALVMDVQFLAHPSLAPFGVLSRTSHKRQVVNVLMADNQVVTVQDTDRKLTIDIGAMPHDALDKILRAFELADERN